MATMKTVTLEEFIKQAHEMVDAFEANWRRNNAAEPDMYPMEIPEDNAGILWEQLADFGEF